MPHALLSSWTNLVQVRWTSDNGLRKLQHDAPFRRCESRNARGMEGAAADSDALVVTLISCAAEFKLDKFWADMAKPVDRAISALRSDDRPLAVRELQSALRSLPPADVNAVGLFAAQRRQIVGVLGILGAEETPPPPPPRPPPPPLAPYAFDQDESDVVVAIAVPPSTRKADVMVVFGRTSVRVAVAGHATQPAVLDGTLEHPVDVDGCSWSLGGEGAQRALSVTFEKASGGLRWRQLLLGGGAGLTAAPTETSSAGDSLGLNLASAAAEARRMEELNEMLHATLQGTELRPLQPSAPHPPPSPQS